MSRLAGGFPSPNYGERRQGLRPSLIVIHYTAMDSCAAAYARLCDPSAEVSAHWLISGQGEAVALVDEAARAWHAGAGSWGGCGDVNSRSIGIELDNPGNCPFAAPQMAALERLLAQIMQRWSIPPQGVIGHSDMAPGRKSDPGARFDWQRLARQGLSVWPDGAAIGHDDPNGDDQSGLEAAFANALRRFGYPDLPLDLLLAAFRLRFRPRHPGGLDRRDVAMARDLARRFAVDPDAGAA